MKLEIFSIHDSATEMYGRPFFMVARGQALRSFKDEINRVDNSNDLAKHPDDFSLYHLGSFDDNTGSFQLFDIPEQVVRGKDIAAMGSNAKE